MGGEHKFCPTCRRSPVGGIYTTMFDPQDAEFYEQHAPDFVRFASALVGPAAAEDLVADTVVRVVRSPGWHRVTNRRAYAYRAMVNEARQLDRADRRRLARERRVGSWPTDAPSTALRPAVTRAMRALSVRERAVVFMVFWLDQPTDQIAATLGVSTRTVQRDLDTSLRTMGRFLDD